MWYYLWPHANYHLVRWFPRNNRTKVSVVLFILTLALLVPQIYVLGDKHSMRYCGQHLFPLLVTSVVLTLFTIEPIHCAPKLQPGNQVDRSPEIWPGFSFLFVVFKTVPRELKISFHVFGVISLVFGLLQIGLTAQAQDCKYSTESLYSISVALAVLSGISIGFLVIMIPFWVLNVFWKNCVLDIQNRNGVCYEPVKCCSCLWHV